MRWMGGRRSDNIEDRRGMGVPLAAGGGIGTIVLVVLALFFGFDPSVILQGDAPTPPVTRAPAPSASPGGDRVRDFVATVLADTEDTWGTLFREMGRQYREPRLVLFSSAVQSACGMAGSATGPFYCPQDQKVYLDLDFFRALRDRFRAPGDFAQAYVIAHEVGHHVQDLGGTLDKAHDLQARASETEGNVIQVRVELQADCYAGVWAANARTPEGQPVMEQGDFEEGMRAAEAIGDDTLQRQTQGRVIPDSFTHGTSAQRMEALQRGYKSGDPNVCKF